MKPPVFAGSVTCNADACQILLSCGPLAQTVTLSLDDAEGIARLILEKCAAARSPILVASNMPRGGS